MIRADVLRLAEIALLSARLLLAALFLLAGATKLVDPAGTRRALRNFGLPGALAKPGMILLPLGELLVAVLLIPVSTAWYAAWGALVLLCVFLLAVGIAMALGRKPDCHCFGQLHSSPVGWPTLVRNIMLAACAGLLVWGGPRIPALDPWAWFMSLSGDAFKIGLAVLFVAAAAFLHVVSRARPRKVAAPVPVVDEPEEEAAEEQQAPQPAVRGSAKPAIPAQPQPLEAAPGPLGLGLAIGMPAPGFELPSVAGERRSLQSLLARGRDVLLIFSSPFCESCNALAQKLVKWMREMEGLPYIVLISSGKPEDNLAKLKDFDASRVLLQSESEVSNAYDSISTPTAVLVGAGGRIQSGLATGAAAIRELLVSSQKIQERKRINRQAPV
ncbi:MAG TPA: MauE/DoxX family redox-associated membrane protein [Bryobacteraceae bacterium]|jgi:peroxiredoxin/uncharacterized membrane protein YphA (DoxX/SURF4 family)|nr:MauE/DoxX family redox-associated membrane protein [Bryobacteraceae bacterium]